MTRARTAAIIALTIASSSTAFAHSGPPFPIVTTEAHGPYAISIWSDPDATDNGSAAGQFWVVIDPSAKGATIPAGTHAVVSVHPLSDVAPAGPRASAEKLTSAATPVRGDMTNQFATVVLDHEGPFAVHVDIDGPLGAARVDSRIDATYDLRPAPYMLAWYLGPFVLAGLLWTRLLIRRRALARGRSGRVHP